MHRSTWTASKVWENQDPNREGGGDGGIHVPGWPSLAEAAAEDPRDVKPKTKAK